MTRSPASGAGSRPRCWSRPAWRCWYFVSNTAHNLEARRIASGFGFLWREAGFEIGETA